MSRSYAGCLGLMAGSVITYGCTRALRPSPGPATTAKETEARLRSKATTWAVYALGMSLGGAAMYASSVSWTDTIAAVLFGTLAIDAAVDLVNTHQERACRHGQRRRSDCQFCLLTDLDLNAQHR